MYMINYITIIIFQIQGSYRKKDIQLKYVIYQMGQTQNSCGFRQIYSLHLNALDGDLATLRPQPVRTTLEEGTMTSHSHHTNIANSAGGAVAWLLKLQSKMVEDADLLCSTSQRLTI